LTIRAMPLRRIAVTMATGIPTRPVLRRLWADAGSGSDVRAAGGESGSSCGGFSMEGDEPSFGTATGCWQLGQRTEKPMKLRQISSAWAQRGHESFMASSRSNSDLVKTL